MGECSLFDHWHHLNPSTPGLRPNVIPAFIKILSWVLTTPTPLIEFCGHNQWETPRYDAEENKIYLLENSVHLPGHCYASFCSPLHVFLDIWVNIECASRQSWTMSRAFLTIYNARQCTLIKFMSLDSLPYLPRRWPMPYYLHGWKLPSRLRVRRGLENYAYGYRVRHPISPNEILTRTRENVLLSVRHGQWFAPPKCDLRYN